MASLGHCGPCSTYVVNGHDLDPDEAAHCPQCRGPLTLTTDTAELVALAHQHLKAGGTHQ